MRKTSNRKSKGATFTKGELNKLIDSLCHPLCKKDEDLIFADTFLHALVEQDLAQTIKKFIKYNLPKLIKQQKKT